MLHKLLNLEASRTTKMNFYREAIVIELGGSETSGGEGHEANSEISMLNEAKTILKKEKRCNFC